MSDKSNEAPTSANDKPETSNRGQRPYSDSFRKFIAEDWAPAATELPKERDVAPYAATRREAVSRAFSGERLVFPAGPLKQRSNDTDYRFRPHSAFAHLTGCGTDEEPDAVFVMEPTDQGHDPVLYFRPMAPRDTMEFYANPRYGELWVGRRPRLDELSAELGITCRHIDQLKSDLVKNIDTGTSVRVVREADSGITRFLDAARNAEAGQQSKDDKLAEFVSELRLIKDEWELNEMQLAVDATVKGFHNVIRNLPQATSHKRGERVVEVAFEAVARTDGNGVGYDTIAAAGNHACTLHWIRNDGQVRDGELLLLDAGMERDSLYTADVTRTVPINGTFTETQRKVYQAVLDAADAAFEHAKPGVTFASVHDAAMRVIATRLVEWGLLDCTVEETLDKENGNYHRRWMVHGTSHHLGIDVHDCAQARREMYLEATLKPGMVFTIEPGLYFKAEDHKVPAEYRGIGVRIEDDVVVTEDGVRNLSADLPREADEIEEWMDAIWAG